MKNNTIKNIVIAVLAVALVASCVFGIQQRQKKLEFKEQSSYKSTKLVNGTYKVSGHLAGKKATIADNEMIIDGGKAKYLLVRGATKNSADVKNIVVFQNKKQQKNMSSANVFSVRKSGDKYDFYTVREGKVGERSFTLTSN